MTISFSFIISIVCLKFLFTLPMVHSNSYAGSESKCEENIKLHQPKVPDITCSRVFGTLYNRSVIHESTAESTTLSRFSEIAEKLLNTAVESCNYELETCVSKLLAYGCSLQYSICFVYNTNVNINKNPYSGLEVNDNGRSYLLTQPCKSFCTEVEHCVKLYPEVHSIVNTVVSDAEMSVASNAKCYDQNIVNTDGQVASSQHYCRYTKIDEETKILLSPEQLYNQWGIKRCCSASGTKNECCNHEDFLEIPPAKSCVMKCDSKALYSNIEQVLAFNWIFICATICAVSSGITVLTYLADVTRFAYPEKPIICHSVCCLFYALGHFFRILTGVDGVGCTQSKLGRVYLQEGLDGEFICTMSFLVIYYAQMALHIWWVILAVSWYLTAAKGWSQEALESISIWFHVIAWGVASVPSVIVLATKRFEGDPLTGLCVVGSQTPINLLYFILIPVSLCAILGMFLITYGFVSVFKVRKRLRTTKIDSNLSAVDTKRFDKLMIRMSVFTISYIMPTAVYLVLTTYEYVEIPKWYKSLNTGTSSYQAASSVTPSGGNVPEIYMLLIKIFSPFVLCIGTCFWILNCKTFKLWSKVIFRCCQSPQSYSKNGQPMAHPTNASQPNLLNQGNTYHPANTQQVTPSPIQSKAKKSQQPLLNSSYMNGAHPIAATRYNMGEVWYNRRGILQVFINIGKH